jgi:hypothetical protein
VELERHHQAISKYAGDFTNLYTLWAVVALHQESLPGIEVFALKYSAFMEDVNRYKDEEYLGKVVSGEETPSDMRSLKYP